MPDEVFWTEREFLVRIWEIVLVLKERTEQMAEGFTNLQAAVDAISGEGGEIAQAKDAILAAVAGLQSVVSTLQTALADARAAVVASEQRMADTGITAGSQAETLDDVRAQFDAVEQQLNDAATALQNPPPAEPTP